MRITFEDVEYRYQVNTPFEHLALHDVNLSMIQVRIRRLSVIQDLEIDASTAFKCFTKANKRTGHHW